MKNFDSTLYFITDSTGWTEEEFLRRVEEALKGGATLVQLREKDKSTREYMSLGEKVHKLTKAYNVPLIIDFKEELIVEGEAISLKNDFDLINEKLEKYKEMLKKFEN